MYDIVGVPDCNLLLRNRILRPAKYVGPVGIVFRAYTFKDGRLVLPITSNVRYSDSKVTSHRLTMLCSRM